MTRSEEGKGRREKGGEGGALVSGAGEVTNSSWGNGLGRSGEGGGDGAGGGRGCG